MCDRINQGGGVGAVVAFYVYLVIYVPYANNPTWLPEVLGWVTAVLLFILFGLLTLKLQKFMIILGSAAIGAFLMILGPLILLDQILLATTTPAKGLPDWADWIFIAGYAVVWVAGVLVQVHAPLLEPHVRLEYALLLTLQTSSIALRPWKIGTTSRITLSAARSSKQCLDNLLHS